MKYLHFSSRSLKDLVPTYKGGSFPWEQLGTSAKAINLDKIDGGNMTTDGSGGIAYLLPVVNEGKALFFIDNNLKQYNIDGEIITEEEALAQWDAYKQYKSSLK